MEQTIEHCKKLIEEMNKIPFGKNRDKIRNELFYVMEPFFHKWISSLLIKRGISFSFEEIKSLSWDCFEYGLKHFKAKGPIPILNHFYAYTKFKLSASRMNKSDKNFKRSMVAIGKENIPPDDLFLVYEQIEELKAFRSLLPEKYIFVFDDAVMSLVPDNREWLQRMNKDKLSYVKYQEVKRVFKIMIEFLLIR